MAQRLVRKLCDCKEEYTPTPELKKEIEKTIKSISSATNIKIPLIEKIYRPKGCEKCNYFGYKGRTTVSEVLIMDKEIEKLISFNALSSEIKEKAVEKGMLTMYQDGILNVLEGKTTMEEINRIIKNDK
jgi:type II secretory ATPase GspE/PulE/Tfp pilus assembly ATPase PilB-like protein